MREHAPADSFVRTLSGSPCRLSLLTEEEPSDERTYDDWAYRGLGRRLAGARWSGAAPEVLDHLDAGRRMERALTEARTNGLSQDRAEAAEQLVLLSTAIGKHDRRTRGHSERVRLYAELLAEELHLDKDERHKLQWAALIHDMGKITVPPEILNKRGKPNDGEWSILQNHPARGEELVAPVADWLGEWVHAVGGHHERWDGTGYPRRLAGSDIPRAAAMVAVADSFEVMTAVRSYKSAMSLADARAELTRCSGTHFSPDMVRAFLNVSLPKLRRAGGLLASLAHVPFIGNALTVSAKAPEAWGYGLTNLANAGGSAVAAAAVTGVLMTAPASADAHRPDRQARTVRRSPSRR